MITSVIFFALLGTLGFIGTATPASINYEPIKITVNKNYYQPQLEGQAEDIYSKPHINLPPGYIPSYIKYLISLIKQKTKSCSKETSVLVEKEVSEILKPLADQPLPDFTKVTLPGNVSREETITEIIKLLEDLLTELVAIPEEHSTIIEAVKPTITIGEKLELPPPPPPLSTPIIIEDEPNLTSILTETPIISPVSNDISEEEINNEPVFMENFVKISPECQKGSTDQLSDPSKVPEEFPSPPLSQLIPIPINDKLYPDSLEVDIIPEMRVLPPLSLGIIPSIAESKEQLSLNKSAVSPLIQEISAVLRPDMNSESKHVLLPSLPLPIPMRNKNEYDLVIPEAPVLPPLSLHMIPPIAENTEFGKSVLLEESEVSSPIPEISTVLLPDTYLRPEELPPPPSPLQISMKITNEPITATSQALMIPEAPVLPPLSLNIIPPIFKDGNNNDPVLLDESNVSPLIQEKSKITLSGTGLVSEKLPSPLPPQPVLILINDESSSNENEYPSTSKVGIILKTPILSPLSDNMTTSNAEKMKIEGQVLLAKSEVSPPIQEISTILHQTSSESEELPLPSPPLPPALVKVDDEPNFITLEVEIIPEAPILPPLPLDVVPIINEKVKIEEPVLGEPGKLSPMPPLLVPNVISNVANPITSEIVIIPDPPVLPPLSLDITPPIVKEVKNEILVLSGESEVSHLIKDKSTVLLPYTTTELQKSPPPPPPAPPILIKMNDEPNPLISEIVTIPEAPVLSSLSYDMIHSNVENMKVEGQLLLEKSEVPSPIQEMSTVLLPNTRSESEDAPPPPPPLPILVKVNDEPNPVTPEVEIIAEARILPPLSLDIIPTINDKVKIEEPVLGHSEVFPQIQEMSRRLFSKTSKEPGKMLLTPPLSVPNVINNVANRITSEVMIIPKSPVLPPLDIISLNIKEVKNEEPVLAGESELSHLIEENSTVLRSYTTKERKESSSPPPVHPIVIKINKEPNPITSEVVTIPEAPVLPPLSLDFIRTFVEEVKNKGLVPLGEPVVSRLIQENSMVLLPNTNINPKESMPPPSAIPIQFKKIDEPNPVTTEDVIIPEAPVLPPLSLDEIPLVTEEVKIKEPLIVEEISSILLPDTNLESEKLPAPPPLLSISIKNDEPNISTSENHIFPAAPILPPVSLDIIPPIVEEMENEKPIVADPKDKKRLTPSTFTNRANKLKVFTNVPIHSRLSTSFNLPKSKENENIIPKLDSLQPYFIQRINKNPQFRSPQVIFEDRAIIIFNPKFERNNQFQLYTSCAHNIIEKRIAPYFAFMKRTRPKKITIKKT